MSFYEDINYDFDPNWFEVGIHISKDNMKYDAKITSNIYNENINFKVKLSRPPDFGGNKDSWINFREFFESIAEVACIEETLNELCDNEELQKDRLKSSKYYPEQNTKMFKVLKKSTAKGTDRVKLKKYKHQLVGEEE